MIKKFIDSEFGKGSLMLFFTMGLFNLLNFIFHFSMGRLLGPVDYGILAVLMSLVYLYSVPAEAIQTIITKYSSKFNVAKEKGKINFLIRHSLKKGIKFAFILFIILIFVSIFISIFLDINYWLILLTNTILFGSFSSPIIRGVLQGRKKFWGLGNNMISESLLKLIFSISLVLLGFRIFGAIMGVLLGVFSAIIFGLYYNRDILITERKRTEFNGIYSQSIPYFISIFVIILVFNMDLILAKRFFNPELAGQYAGLSMIGKIIFFGTIAISKAMFPLSVEKYEKEGKSTDLLKKSFLSVIILCIFSITFYYFFPELIISILYGSEYIAVAPYLVYVGIAFAFLSLSNLVIIYGLSGKGIKKPLHLFWFLIFEVILLSIFNKNLLEYVLAFMFSNIVMFIGSLFFLKK